MHTAPPVARSNHLKRPRKQMQDSEHRRFPTQTSGRWQRTSPPKAKRTGLGGRHGAGRTSQGLWDRLLRMMWWLSACVWEGGSQQEGKSKEAVSACLAPESRGGRRRGKSCNHNLLVCTRLKYQERQKATTEACRAGTGAGTNADHKQEGRPLEPAGSRDGGSGRYSQSLQIARC